MGNSFIPYACNLYIWYVWYIFIGIILGLSAIDVFSLDFGLFSYLNVAVWIFYFARKTTYCTCKNVIYVPLPLPSVGTGICYTHAKTTIGQYTRRLFLTNHPLNPPRGGGHFQVGNFYILTLRTQDSQETSGRPHPFKLHSAIQLACQISRSAGKIRMGDLFWNQCHMQV